jgi:hypothetical protein
MKKSKFITEFKDIPTPREKMPHIPLEERKQNFREVELSAERRQGSEALPELPALHRLRVVPGRVRPRRRV